MIALGNCIEWDGSRQADGYGQLTVQGSNGVWTTLRVHRLVWEIFHGPIPPGMCVCHHCDNPPCIRVDHLFLGTNADNVADRDAKGRQAWGERHARATLTAKQVLEIRAEYELGAPKGDLARQYGATLDCIRAIVERRSWRHLEGSP